MERFKNLCRDLMRTSSKKRKVEILVNYMKDLTPREREVLAKLLLSMIDGYTLSVIKEAVGDFIIYYRGDTYEAVFNYLSQKGYRQKALIPKNLSLLEVVNSLERASKENRATVLRGIVFTLDVETASLLIASLLKDLQIGVGEGIFLESLAKLEGRNYEEMKNTLYTLGWGAIFESNIYELNPGIPFRPMLAEKAMSLNEIIKEGNFWVEPKLDGIRVLVHKDGEKIKVFSRKRKDITNQFPEIVEYVYEIEGSLILDGEAIALRDGKILPFQNIMRRFAERKNVNVDFYFFDIVYFGSGLFKESYIKRRSILEDIVDKSLPRFFIDKEDELREKFPAFISKGYEGIVCKKEYGEYAIGRRTKDWLKYKRTFEVDAVIVAAEWGHGRRRNWLSDYHLALWHGEELVEVGKTFKGLTDKEMSYITRRLLELKIKDIPDGIVVKPKIVVEVEFEDIQISPKYEKYTLRFARIKRIREDKDPEDAGKIEEIERIYRYLHGSF